MGDKIVSQVHVVMPAELENIDVPDAILPSVRTVFLGGIFFIMLFAAMRASASLLLPIVLAFVLKMVLEPFVRALGRARIPRVMAAILIMVVLFGGLLELGSRVSAPAVHQVENVPNILPELQQKLSVLQKPLHGISQVLERVQTLTGQKPVQVTMQGEGFSDHLLMNTRTFVTEFFQTIVVLFFLLIAGDTFLRRVVEILPRFKDKRQAVDISQQVERDISAYLATITAMNIAVGVATWLAMRLCHVEDASLWGIVAFLLNYIPIVGPTVCIAVFVMVGLLSTTLTGNALLPAELYVVITLIEGINITPMLLAKRFTLNPVMVLVSLMFWYWMWGVPGAILSTPMLAIFKIICDRITSLKAFGHFLEGESRRGNANGSTSSR